MKTASASPTFQKSSASESPAAIRTALLLGFLRLALVLAALNHLLH